MRVSFSCMIKLLFGCDGLKTNPRGEILSHINGLCSCGVAEGNCASSAHAACLPCSSVILCESIGRSVKENGRKAQPSSSVLYLSLQVAERPRDFQLSSCKLHSPAKQTALRSGPGFGAGVCSLHWPLGIGGGGLFEGKRTGS